MVGTYKRSAGEKVFLLFFFPVVIFMYLIYKYPTWFVPEEKVVETFYFFGKSTSFWYSTLYTGIVCLICLYILFKGKTPYGTDKSLKLTSYQKKKWISIFLSQFILFYFIPYFMPFIKGGGEFFADTYTPLNKNAYVYVYNGFTSLGGFIYIFLLVPVSVWFFGKRYCSWFCACGNLAETIGVTPWGAKWVKMMTPRGEKAKKLELIQYIFLIAALIFGVILFMDAWKIMSAPNLIAAWWQFQDLVVDLIFGALIGVGAYPILGTRIWCRYGCPLAAGMRFFGKHSKSKFTVQANDKCVGISLCSQVCPMGIDVASYAHKNGKPINGSFSLMDSTCIGCGGCVDVCPVDALSFTNTKK
ncbi:MAG: 4Fe-4S binding protein [Bacteriovoracaceae bacterium]|jgi:polyferredoxin|nr:4Fe-4S binding protein [Bacteriovoracaceae bacterium]